MLQSSQQTKKFDLNYYVISHQWFREAYIFRVICRTRTNFQILPKKTPLVNIMADH